MTAAPRPKLTISVRRGLKTLGLLAGADIDADQSNDSPNYKGRGLQDIRKAQQWIDSLDTTQRQPRKPR